MFEQVSYQQRRAVAVAGSAASADLIVTTLAVHGIPAATMAIDRVYPSVNWAQGHRMAVAAEDEERARELLASLSREDVISIDDEGHRTT